MAAKTKRVLFVDDDLSLLVILQQLMSHYAGASWEVLTAPDVSKALGILQEGRIDLLVFDIHMPVVDGVQFLRLLQRKFPNLLKVVLTGAASEETRATCLSCGAELYLEKPKDQGGWQSVHATLHELTRFQPEDGFRGVLRQVGLQDVLQMECLARHSVVLHIRAETLDGRVFVKDGQIIHAQCAGRKGEEAFNQMLSLTGGEFDLLSFTAPPEQTITGSWEFLLMEAARQRDECGEPGTENTSVAAIDIPDMFQAPPAAPATAAAAVPPAPVLERQAAPPLVVHPAPPAVTLPKQAVRLVEPEPETALPSDASRPRTDELLVCSLQGEILHEWKCANPNSRVTFLEFVSQKARQLAQGLPVGEFDRVEVNAVNTRVVAQVQAERGLFVRCSRVPLEIEGNSFGA